MTRVCNICEIEKGKEDFYITKENKFKMGCCKLCYSEKSKKYYEQNKEKKHNRYENNKEELKEKRKEYYDENKEEIQEKYKKYYEKNKEQIIDRNKKNYNNLSREQKDEKNETTKKNYHKNIDSNRKKKCEYIKNRLRIDVLFKLNFNTRSLIRKSITYKFTKKSKKTIEILGCSFEEFKIHIESQFKDWMTWENYGIYNGELNYGWDIDHKIPTSSAETEEEIIKLNHYTNLQPLCGYINRYIKKDKI